MLTLANNFGEITPETRPKQNISHNFLYLAILDSIYSYIVLKTRGNGSHRITRRLHHGTRFCNVRFPKTCQEKPTRENARNRNTRA